MISRWVRWTVFFGSLGVASWYYAWAPPQAPLRWLDPRPTSYYDELGDALLRGHLQLARTPDPRLEQLPDPYDPARNAPFRVNDVSYYRGHYYLYHGIAPALTLYLPTKLVTGRYLTDAGACLILMVGGLLASGLLLQELQRHCFPDTPQGVWLIGAAALAVGNGYHVVLHGPANLNDAAIAAGYCYLGWSLWAAVRGLYSRDVVWPWFALASLAYGLAIASRPNYAFGGFALTIPAWAALQGERKIRTAWRHPILLAVATPAAVVVAALMVCNYLKFSNPLEFGMRYMLGAWDQRRLATFELRQAAANAWQYFLAPGIYHRDFPFVTAPDGLAIGILRHQPFVILTLLLPWMWPRLRQLSDGPRRVIPVFLMLLGVATANLMTLLLLPSGDPIGAPSSANARYLPDFLPILSLLAAATLLAVYQRSRSRRLVRWTVAGSALLLLAITAVATISQDLSGFPAEGYRRIGRVLDLPSSFYWHRRGFSYGPVALDIAFPVGATGAREPLVETGAPGSRDLVYAWYESPTTIRFGLVGTDAKGPLSNPVQIDYHRSHRLTIAMGSLFPDLGDPLAPPMEPEHLRALHRSFILQLDGKTVIAVPAQFHPAQLHQPIFGDAAEFGGYSAARFTGTIGNPQRLPFTSVGADTARTEPSGPMQLTVRLPTGKTGSAEPLVVTGVPRAGDAVYIVYETGHSIRFGVDHWGYPGFISPSVAVDYRTAHRIRISADSLISPPEDSSGVDSNQTMGGRNARLTILLDGRTVVDIPQTTFASSPVDVTVGANLIGSSACGPTFTGQIEAVSRSPAVRR